VKSQKYLKFIVENNLNNRINLIGRIDHSQLKYYLDKADIFCMPSRYESFGLAALEAMACGIPVVAANVGGLSELIINGFNGYLCERDSPKLLAKSIEKAASEKWDYANIAKWAEENYSWKKWAEKIIEIVKENIEG
jgi:D-inositol-3-phosphate glycosyltransferase